MVDKDCPVCHGKGFIGKGHKPLYGVIPVFGFRYEACPKCNSDLKRAFKEGISKLIQSPKQ